MTGSRFPVFWKDLRSLLKPMGEFLALQAVGTVLFFLIFRRFEGGWPPLAAVGEVTVLAALGLGQIFGLVAAGYVYAEEHAAGTAAFLARLPTSRARITLEKLGAGVTVLALLLLVQVTLHLAALPLGGLWPTVFPLEILDEFMSWMDSPGAVFGTLALYYFGSYLVGILVSLVTRQTLVIVVVGYALESILYGFAMMGVKEGLFITWDLAWLNLVVYASMILAPLLVMVPGSRFRMPGAAFLLAPGRGPLSGLVWKSATENGTLHALCLAFLLGALLAPPGVDTMLVMGIALLLLVALGTASYAPVEKQGLDCVLYQHPVARHQLFVAKLATAVLPVLAVWGGAVVLWDVPTAGQVAATLAYAAFAYACAVLMTLTFERPVIALLATICVIDVSLLLPVGLTSFMEHVIDVDFTVAGATLLVAPGQPGGEPVVVLLGMTLPAGIFAAGSLWAARRMATDPAVLTGSPAYRIRSFTRLYGTVMAVAAAVLLVWWREPLALIW